MSDRSPILTVSAAWERSALRLDRDETALMLTVTAQRRATRRPAGRSPIDVAFVLDRSGSMSGDKIELAREAVNRAIGHLGPEDRVALVTFDNEIEVVRPLAPANDAIKAVIRNSLRHAQARGSTNLSDGWLTACQELANAAGEPTGARLQRAILLTDGQANSGITDPSELAMHATALRERGISTTTMGIGHGFDEVLLGGLAEAGGGNFQYVAHPGQLTAFFEREIGGLTEVAALRPQVELTLPQGLRAQLLNTFPNHRQGKAITVELRDLVDRDTVDLVFVVTHRGNLGPTSPHVTGNARAVEPDSGARIALDVEIPALAFVPEAEARTAPVNHAVSVARAHEQALREQREALRLDREGRYVESRQVFAASHDRLRDANTQAAASGYAGMTESAITYLQTEAARSSDLASAPAAPLGEQVHKERAAYRSNHSRGGRREDDRRS